jgi:hypothetical protein
LLKRRYERKKKGNKDIANNEAVLINQGAITKKQRVVKRGQTEVDTEKGKIDGWLGVDPQK